MNKMIVAVGTVMELAGIAGLAYIALKRNNDAYKAAIKCIDLETELAFSKLDNTLLNIKNEQLNKENEKLKKQLGEA